LRDDRDGSGTPIGNLFVECSDLMPQEQRVNQPRSPRVIVAAVIITDGRVLACERSAPPEVAGRWEFPGGKVEPGESDEQALARECAEELGVRVEVGARVGPDVPLARGRAVLRVFAVTLLDGGTPRALEHASMRWLAVDELDSVHWLPADQPIVAELPALLR
jgi:8-oxo-dGTP diphosphatase